LLMGQTFCNGTDTLTGKVVSINNPCTTDPCLPGGVIALQTDSISYILTINHEWNIDSFNVDGRYIKIDDSIQVIGIIYEKVDLKDKIYYEIEIEEVFFFDITTIENNKTSKIEIFPNPSDGIIKITAQEKRIVKITIINMEGKLIFSSKYPYSESVYIENIKEKGMVILKLDLNSNESVTQKILLK